MDDYYPGYAQTFTKIGKERGWPPVTRASFDAVAGARGALLVGDPKEVAEKIIRHSKALGGISRVTFQMDSANLTHEKMMEAINLLGSEVKPLIKDKI
jgi:alkanesulfonate monooxygenase SsuD/methylene tetrahydromethanopterin reductase-like flavin-dependent oxidoreductase (luciferase family)